MKTTQVPANELIDEITRYLAAVDLFRSLGSEPRWRPEASRPTEPPAWSRSGRLARRAH